MKKNQLVGLEPSTCDLTNHRHSVLNYTRHKQACNKRLRHIGKFTKTEKTTTELNSKIQKQTGNHSYQNVYKLGSIYPRDGSFVHLIFAILATFSTCKGRYHEESFGY